MDNSQTREMMLNFINEVRNELDALLDGLSTAQKNERGSLQRWGVKDTLAHLAFWGDHFNRQLEAAHAGSEVPAAGDYFEIVNDGVLMRNLDKPFEQSRGEEQAAHEKMVALLKIEPPDDLVNSDKYAYLSGRSLLDNALGSAGWHVMAHISDYYLQENRYLKTADLQETFAHKLEVFPTWKANALYNLACFYSLHGEKEKALSNLELAFREKADLIEWSKKDSDIDPLRNEPVYQKLIG